MAIRFIQIIKKLTACLILILGFVFRISVSKSTIPTTLSKAHRMFIPLRLKPFIINATWKQGRIRSIMYFVSLISA